MSIDFACAHCSKPYRVKDELAGKTAKCGKCGERMQIPQFLNGMTKAPAATQAAAASKPVPAPKSPATVPKAPGAAPKVPAGQKTAVGQKTVATRPAAAPSANGARPRQPSPQPQNRPTAPQKTAASAATSGANAWLDDELLAAPATQQARAKDTACPKCGTRQPTGSVICSSCGEMLSVEATVSNRPVLLKPLPAKQSEPPKKKKRKRKLKLNLDMDSVAGLIKGTAFCIGLTFIGALLWSGIAVLIGFELRIFAVALGGLAGYGMALGHNNDNGLLAGIIAGFISFCGIIGAKILIVIFLVATLVASGMDNFKRELVIQGIAQEIIEQQGGNAANVSLDQQERAVKTAREAVDAMDDAQIEAKYNELEAKWENEPEAAEPEVADVGENEAATSEDEAKAADEDAAPEVQDAAAERTQAPVALENAAVIEPPVEDSGTGSRGLFRIMDLFWIIAAVGTAFKLGSGMGE